jgi:hypothetical protein
MAFRTKPLPVSSLAPFLSWLATPAGVFLLVLALRLPLAVTLAAVTGGNEFSDDVRMHLIMSEDPFGVLLGRSWQYRQHPPLLPVVEGIFIAPLRPFAGTYLAPRFAFILFEAIAAGFFAAAARRLLPDAARAPAVLGIALTPTAIMTSTVMCQDEVIGQLAVAAIVWAVATGRNRTAIAIASLGVVTAKIFLAAPLLVLILALPTPRPIERFLLGIVPPAALSLLSAYLYLSNMGSLPVLDFTPVAGCSETFWVPFLDAGFSKAAARTISSLLCVGAIGAVLLAIRNRPGRRAAIDGTASVLAGLFVLFYLVNPEYWPIALPALALVLVRRGEWLLLHVALTLPWAENFFYGVAAAEGNGTGGSKGAFVRLYRSLFPGSPRTWMYATLAITVVATIAVAAVSFRRLLESPPGEGEFDPPAAT